MPPPSLDILYVITKASWGGAQRYVYDLATALKAEGRTVAVAYGSPGLLSERLEEAGIRTIQIPSMARDIRVGSDIRSFFALRTLFIQERPHVVHLNSSKAGGLGALAARLAHVPRIIFTAHGWAWNEDRSLPARLIIRALAWITVLLSHITICVSASMREDAAWMPCTRKRLVVVKNGIAAPLFLARDRARKELMQHPPEGTWVGMISELHSTKRVVDAVRAFSRLAPTYSNLSLIIMGEGEERPALETFIAKLGLTDRVHFLGFVRDAATYLPAFDVFLHTSRSESFGYVIAEAGHAGLPVVAAHVGALPEIIQNTTLGTLVPLTDTDAIAKALARYVDTPELRTSHGAALKERVEREFSVERMARETSALYRYPTNS